MSNVIDTLAAMQQEEDAVRVVANIPAAVYHICEFDGDDDWENAFREIIGEIPKCLKRAAINALLAGDTSGFKNFCKMIAENVEDNYPDVYYTALDWGTN